MNDFTIPRRGEARRGAGRRPGRRITHTAVTDDFTGLPNRLHLEVVFDVVFEMGDRGIPLTLVQLEIDGMDAFETAHGRDRALEVIRAFGTTLGASTRRMDVFARVGQARFAALLQDCNLQGGLVAAERMRELLEDWSGETGLTFSAGVASWRPEMLEPSELWERAEEALAEAQRRGGDQLEIASAAP